MMALHGGRQRGDSMAVGSGGGGGGSSSSIALLQERFRQLERMREKREEMELLKSFSGTDTVRRTKNYERPGNLVHPEMAARSSFQESLSLGLDLYGKKKEYQPLKTPPYRDFWSMDLVTVSTSRTHEKPDVDTSLHL
ncbi:hypothetical protein L1887_04006 [Cichorium endivia]|nr:hypothetical protein L1887_04006 [Cichorium endivia]